MSALRIIPRLDIKGPNLVKGIHFEGLRVLGAPEDFARFYYEQGADELMYQDVVASLYERNSLREIISRTAKEIFIPLTVGGGIRSLQDIHEALRAGADKVAINTAAIRNPEFIREAARKYGSSTIIVAIEVIRQHDGRYLCYTDNGREETGIEAKAWAQQAESLGAGEILLSSVDREGTGMGFDTGILQEISSLISIPLIAHGGMGKASDVIDAVHAGADAVAMASVLHYGAIESGAFASPQQNTEGNRAFLESGKSFTKIKGMRIAELREALIQHNIPCRI